jgi:tetratricopeptide (TPR) repeat protein
LRRQHKLKESELILDELIKSLPQFSPAYISLAYIKYIQMDFEKSVQLARKVIGQGADNVDLSNYVRSYAMMAGAKGMIAHYGGPLSKAINGIAVMSNLRKAERLQPDSPGVLFGLGSFYLLAPGFAGGNVDKAGPYLEKAIKIDPGFSDAYVRLAQFYKLKRDNEKYQAYLNKALEIDPQSELALDIKNGNCKFICINAQE